MDRNNNIIPHISIYIMTYTHHIANTLNLPSHSVKNTLSLLDQSATIPFIARYRKELTGSLDEVQISAIRDTVEQLKALDDRRKSILSSLEKQGVLTETLQKQVASAPNLTVLEDLYLPHRPKRRTRGTIARERGLEPLAKAILSGKPLSLNIKNFIDLEKGVNEVEDAYAGARDIIAERINVDISIRKQLRALFSSRAVIISKAIEKNKEKGQKFKDYFLWNEPVTKLAGHRFLAMLRGENEKFLSLTIQPPEDTALNLLKKKYVHKAHEKPQLTLAVEDAYKRLLVPSLENELKKDLKEKAEMEAIEVFGANIKELLLAPPLGSIRVMALDPGYRTGAKVVCLDEQGKLLHSTTLFPTHGKLKQEEAKHEIIRLVENYSLGAIAIGNGTAGRETEIFIRSLDLPSALIITMVNEDGASIYSASESARREFPTLDLTVRGSISIGRRLQDPLAELVKIDPKSIGVGQYQHDVDQNKLKNSLKDIIINCVNSVGVDLNHASVELLSHVSGLGPVLAENIVNYRKKNGPYTSRKQLLKVPRLGPKAYEQCAGFLRINGAKNPLDSSGVHPEAYSLVERMAHDSSCSVHDLIKDSAKSSKIDLQTYVSKNIGLPTLCDILQELDKPGRDPREKFQQFAFAENVHTIEDLVVDMQLPGVVTNVTKFGAFVDIGVHNDGLVHISQLADRFVKDPAEVVKPRQHVRVKVLEIDAKRKRISLSMRKK